MNSSAFMQIPINFVNASYKVVAWHWTSMTTAQTTYTISTIDWTTSPPVVHITSSNNANNDTCFFKVTFV
jgi:hypothetical protein